MACIEGNGVLTETQHGFRTKKSTETALQIFIKSTQEAIEKSKVKVLNSTVTVVRTTSSMYYKPVSFLFVDSGTSF
jgi:hypothetical protein